jgi:hypothetical protein
MSPLLSKTRTQDAAPAVQVRRAAVDLLPEAVRRRRTMRAVRVQCVAVLLVVVLALVAGMAWGMTQRSQAQSRRTAAQVEQDRLVAEIATYADVSGLRSEIGAVRTAIADGMRNEVLWADLVRHIDASLPAYAVLESMSIAITFESDFEDGDDHPLDPGDAIGTISWVIWVPTLPQSGSLLTVLDGADGLFGATFTSVDREEGVHKVSGSVRIDESWRAQRYTEEATGGEQDATQEETAP